MKNPEYEEIIMENHIDPRLFSAFCMVRNMPFYVRIGPKGRYLDLRFIIKNGKGACSPKHYLLALIYENIGYKVKYVATPFLWREQPINYPHELKALAKKIPVCYHLSLLVEINGEYVLLDATWDPPLKRANFPVHSFLSGASAIIPCEDPVIHGPVCGHIEMVRQKTICARVDLADSIAFYTMLNAWCAALRKR